MRAITVRCVLRGVVLAALGAGAMLQGERDAQACGGCFTPQPPPQVVETESVITDEKMILSIAMGQTTLYDEITYSGSPASFAWVLPIRGQVTVGLSADILFQTMNQLTATTVTQPPTNCPPAPTCGAGGGAGCGFGSSSNTASPAGFAAEFAEDAGAAGVVVTSQMQVGPYETVQLHSSNGNGAALNAWLTGHGYQVPTYTQPIIDEYVAQSFDFLALKLVPGEGVQAMQPVRVTSQGAAPSLPLHMVAVGTGAVTGITIWVVADARWQPTNFPTFIIQDSELSWDWATSSSNYETLRLSKEAQYNGSGWQVESSLELSQYTFADTLLTNVEYDTNQVGGYAPAPDAGAPLGGTDAGGRLGTDAGRSGDASSPFDAGRDSSQGSGSASGEPFEEVDGGGEVDGEPPAEPSSNAAGQAAAKDDLGVLFAGIMAPNVRITRMRSDVAKAALSVDMSLEAAADQSELSNQYNPSQEIGEPSCPVYNSNCVQTGTAPRSQATPSTNSGSGCSTTRPQNELGTTMAFLLAFGGVSAVRARRKRRA